MKGAATIAAYAVRESVRRRVFVVVLLLTLAFLALYGLGANQAFEDARDFAGPDDDIVDVDAFVGATLFGLAMFATLFLGAVLAIFVTLGTVRGDAERGLLQPLVVRPVGRASLLVARFAAAAGVAGVYVLVVYFAAMGITAWAGGWWPDHVVGPGLGLAGAVAVIAALSLLGSVVLSATANGIAVFMVYGAGLTAGLLGQIGNAVNSDTLEDISRIASWALPFEALYQAGLHALVSDTEGLTGIVLQLGPFGGAQSADATIVPWTLAYVALVLGLAVLAFSRRDL
ncbi:MAG TPA: ABC transporter permease subunit [Solirubrobacteraceae bacterium]|nr:ABC transporter permease subunit [Solirubrobacteraceae bacterium]